MELKEFITKFEDAVDDVKPGSLDEDTVFQSLKAWDSLAVLTVSDVIDMEYGVLLDKDDFKQAQTLQDLYQCVLAKRQSC
jgi:acyl carrier protein